MEKEVLIIGSEYGKGIQKITTTKGTLVEMSCGGGMGGSFWREFITNDDVLENVSKDKFIKCNTLTCKDVLLNTNNIVKATPSVLYVVEYGNNQTYRAIVPDTYNIEIYDGNKKDVNFTEYYSKKFQEYATKCDVLDTKFLK